MATTRLIPLHTGKGRNFGKAIRNVIGYVSNPKKTHQGELVTGFGCNPETADGEFLLMKREYIAQTGRLRGKDDVIAYHLRQSFVPDEITPEEANRIGCELASRFTHGSFAISGAVQKPSGGSVIHCASRTVCRLSSSLRDIARAIINGWVMKRKPLSGMC